ncbi:hypothetical protein Tco_0323299 [Tanacetum coccineum]
MAGGKRIMACSGGIDVAGSGGGGGAPVGIAGGGSAADISGGGAVAAAGIGGAADIDGSGVGDCWLEVLQKRNFKLIAFKPRSRQQSIKSSPGKMECSTLKFIRMDQTRGNWIQPERRLNAAKQLSLKLVVSVAMVEGGCENFCQCAVTAVAEQRNTDKDIKLTDMLNLLQH